MSGKRKHRTRNRKLHGKRIAPRQPTFSKEEALLSMQMGDMLVVSSGSKRNGIGTNGEGKRRGQAMPHEGGPQKGVVRKRPNAGALGAALFTVLVGAASATSVNSLPRSRLNGLGVDWGTFGREPAVMVAQEFRPTKPIFYVPSPEDALQGSEKHRTGRNSYEIPLGRGLYPDERNSISISLEAGVQCVSVRPLFRKGKGTRAYPLSEPFRLGYSNLGIDNPGLRVEEAGPTIMVIVRDRKSGREARFEIEKGHPTARSSGMQLFQELGEGYFSSIADSLGTLPRFGTGRMGGGGFSAFLSKLYASTLRELRRVSPKPGDYSHDASEESVDRLLDDFTRAYQHIYCEVWNKFLPEALGAQDKGRRKQILEYGRRLATALLWRPYAEADTDPKMLERIDFLISRGLPEAEFRGFMDSARLPGYKSVYEAIGRQVGPQMKLILGDGYKPMGESSRR